MRTVLFLFICLLLKLDLAFASQCLENVEQSFKNVKSQVTPLAIWTHDIFDRGSYQQLIKTRFGLDNHMQGIVRVPDSSVMILSGGDRYIKEANLFIATLSATNDESHFTKNFKTKKGHDAPEDDSFVSRINLESEEFWHAGGLAVLDHLLAVPVENPKENKSKIMFFDLTDPLSPQKLEVEILRPRSTTGTILLSRSDEGKILVGGMVKGRVEFFTSKTTALEDGFSDQTMVIQTQIKGQGTDLVRQCDGKLFVLDFNNTSSLAPIIYGKNYVRLWSLDLNSEKTHLLQQRTFDTHRTCNFKAAGSHMVSEDGKLLLYGSSFYRHFGGKQFKLCQFSE
jgi:hypothetical protein